MHCASAVLPDNMSYDIAPLLMTYLSVFVLVLERHIWVGGGGRGGVMKIMKCNNRAGRDNNHLIGRFRQTLGGWGIICY